MAKLIKIFRYLTIDACPNLYQAHSVYKYMAAKMDPKQNLEARQIFKKTAVQKDILKNYNERD